MYLNLHLNLPIKVVSFNFEFYEKTLSTFHTSLKLTRCGQKMSQLTDLQKIAQMSGLNGKYG